MQCKTSFLVIPIIFLLEIHKFADIKELYKESLTYIFLIRNSDIKYIAEKMTVVM